jgi:uncharacterized membrane-anchored protein YjiN (DUF445 family)
MSALPPKADIISVASDNARYRKQPKVSQKKQRGRGERPFDTEPSTWYSGHLGEPRQGIISAVIHAPNCTTVISLFVDLQVGSRDGAIDILHRLRQRDSEVRVQFRAAVAGLVDDLMTSTEQHEKIQRLKNLLLDDPEVAALLASAWDRLSHRLMQELSDPRSNARSTIHSAVLALAHSMREDAFIRTRMDAVIERLIVKLFQWRGEIGLLIAEVVRNWDARTVSDRLELVLGSDLQYIRINGTIVGAFVGCAIYLLSIAIT